jgi:hypothetical protein
MPIGCPAARSSQERGAAAPELAIDISHRIIDNRLSAEVAELADAQDSKSCGA